MVTIIEPTCKKWEHELVNAGLINLVNSIMGSDMEFWGEKNHLNAVKALRGEFGFKTHKLSSIPDRQKSSKNKLISQYLELINRAVIVSRPQTVIVSAAYHECIMSVQYLATIYRSIKFIIILHGMIEPKFGDTRHYIDVIKKNNRCNILYLTYSPFCVRFLKNNGIHNVDFIHHPYIKCSVNKTKIGNELSVGVIGACSNANAARIASELSNERIDNLRFLVFSNYWRRMRGIDGVIKVKGEFERTDIELVMSQIDYLLLPYGKTDYSMSASGVMWDAVSYSKPCICYDSDYLKYYQQRCNIGFVCETIDDMKNTIIDLYHNGSEYTGFFSGLDLFDEENVLRMKSVL